MNLSNIVKQALADGYITPVLKAEVMRFCDSDTVLSTEENFYLDLLLGAILTGEIVEYHVLAA